jgi:hypothetical protein
MTVQYDDNACESAQAFSASTAVDSIQHAPDDRNSAHGQVSLRLGAALPLLNL